jgi:HNH endonuclease
MIDYQEYFQRWTTVDPVTGCWNWQRAVLKDGGGVMGYLDQTSVKAYRVAYMELVGPIPAGSCVLHVCDNRLCCNPGHLRLGSRADNARDRVSKRRNGNSNQLTPEIVQTIRRSSESGAVLADMYGIASSTVSKIRLMKTWEHV